VPLPALTGDTPNNPPKRAPDPITCRLGNWHRSLVGPPYDVNTLTSALCSQLGEELDASESWRSAPNLRISGLQLCAC